jgi:hypothetical protein
MRSSSSFVLAKGFGKHDTLLASASQAEIAQLAELSRTTVKRLRKRHPSTSYASEAESCSRIDCTEAGSDTFAARHPGCQCDISPPAGVASPTCTLVCAVRRGCR